MDKSDEQEYDLVTDFDVKPIGGDTDTKPSPSVRPKPMTAEQLKAIEDKDERYLATMESIKATARSVYTDAYCNIHRVQKNASKKPDRGTAEKEEKAASKLFERDMSIIMSAQQMQKLAAMLKEF